MPNGPSVVSVWLSINISQKQLFNISITIKPIARLNLSSSSPIRYSIDGTGH